MHLLGQRSSMHCQRNDCEILQHNQSISSYPGVGPWVPVLPLSLGKHVGICGWRWWLIIDNSVTYYRSLTPLSRCPSLSSTCRIWYNICNFAGVSRTLVSLELRRKFTLHQKGSTVTGVSWKLLGSRQVRWVSKMAGGKDWGSGVLEEDLTASGSLWIWFVNCWSCSLTIEKMFSWCLTQQRFPAWDDSIACLGSGVSVL